MTSKLFRDVRQRWLVDTDLTGQGTFHVFNCYVVQEGGADRLSRNVGN